MSPRRKIDFFKTVRVQNSLLNPIEKKFLISISKHLPEKVTSDYLTLFGLFGSLTAALGYFLTNYSRAYLWLASLGFVINWFGDSLDGTLARVRHKQRPIYGYFIDHNTDAITAMLIAIGAGLSPFISFYVAMFVVSAYFMLAIFTYINAYLNDEFVITYSAFGPTELRLIIIILNTIFFFVKAEETTVTIGATTFKLFDVLGIVLGIGIIVLYTISFLSYKKKFSKLDPPK